VTDILNVEFIRKVKEIVEFISKMTRIINVLSRNIRSMFSRIVYI